MTFEEFLAFRDVKIKNSDHERIVRLFFPYMESVTGNGRLLPDLIGLLLDIDLSSAAAKTGCFNGVSDGAEPPCNGVDLYLAFDNGIRVYVYGSIPERECRKPGDYEYVLFVLGGGINGAIQKPDTHVYIVE